MSKHYIKGFVILVVLDVPHGLWHHNVIGVFFWHDWHVAYVVFPSSLFCSLIRLFLKLFREVCADDLSHFVTSFLVSGDETSQPTSLPCDNKDVRAQTTTITKRFAGLVARYLLVLFFYCVTGIEFGDAEVCIRMFYDLIMRQYDFRPPPYIFKLIWSKL